MGVDVAVTVRDLMRDVGGALRPAGFRGSGGTWRLTGTEGVAMVEKQGSAGSTGTEALFYLNAAVVPAVWWEWTQSSVGEPAPINKARVRDGLQLLQDRVLRLDRHHLDGPNDLWQVTTDTDLDRLRTELVTAVTDTGRRLSELLSPGRYLQELLALPDKQVGHWKALVVLLAAHGPSPALDSACSSLGEAYSDRPRAAGFVDKLTSWAQARATRAAASPSIHLGQ